MIDYKKLAVHLYPLENIATSLKATSLKVTSLKVTLLKVISVSLISVPLISVSAIADIATQPKDLEEVVVTASKRAQLINDFSGSISVVKMESLNPAATLSDVANQVPGFSLLSSGPRNPAALVMRGLRMDAVDGYENGNDGGTVASYVDNIPLQGFFVPPAFSLKDLQQIEILRGPQGTLYGNASLGGLIRYITAKPDLARNSVNMNAMLSQTAEASGLNGNADLVVNAPLIDNTLGIRFLLGKEKNQGFIDNPYLLDGAQENINGDKTRQVRLSTLWKPDAQFSLSGSFHYQKITADDRQASNKSYSGDDFTASSKYLQPMSGDLVLAAIDAVYQFDFATLTASINQYDYKTKTRSDQTDYLLTLDNTNGWGYYTSFDQFSAYTESDIKVKKNSAELRLVSPDDDAFRWLVGALFSDDTLDFVVADTVPGFGIFAAENRPHDLDYYATQNETLHEQAIYAEAIYDLKPEWEVSLGARGFRYKDDADTCSLLFPTSKPYTGDNYPVDCLMGNDSYSNSLGKFTTKYKFNSGQTIYVNIAEGFRRGGANFLPIDIDHNRRYEPDTAVNYELGSHSKLFQDSLSLSAALFYTDWKKVQVKSVVEGYGAWLNTGSARSQGVELELEKEINKKWSTRLSYSFADAALTESVANINGEGANAYDGDTLPGSPSNQWSLGIDYAGSISTALLSANLNYSYVSDSYTELNSEFADYTRLRGYGICNASTRVMLRNWQVGIFVNNLTNTRGITGRRAAPLFGEAGQFEYLTRPRTLGLFLSYQL